MRWLLDWHHLAPQTQLAGEEGVLAALEQLEGFEAPAVEWERTLLPARVADYDPAGSTTFASPGVIGWGRVSPHPAWPASEGAAPRRVIPTNAAPITFFLRESADWLPSCARGQVRRRGHALRSRSRREAQQIRALLADRGAAFSADLQRLSGLTKLQTCTALWELATAGLASADGFDQLRAHDGPAPQIRRRRANARRQPAQTRRRAHHRGPLVAASAKPHGSRSSQLACISRLERGAAEAA